MSQDRSASRSRSKSRSPSGGSRSRSRSLSLVSTASGRAARLRDWDGEAGYRLHVSPLNPRTKRKDIEKIFLKFGTINEVWMATNPPCFAFVNYKHREDAEEAIRAMDGKSIDGSRVGISYARKRTIGGRRGGGGGDRYSRDRDSSRYRRRYSPRPSDDRYDRRRRYSRSRSRSPVQRSKRDYRQRSRSASPRPRRNRSPQQQSSNIVHRYDD